MSTKYANKVYETQSQSSSGEMSLRDEPPAQGIASATDSLAEQVLMDTEQTEKQPSQDNDSPENKDVDENNDDGAFCSSIFLIFVSLRRMTVVIHTAHDNRSDSAQQEQEHQELEEPSLRQKEQDSTVDGKRDSHWMSSQVLDLLHVF